jgi:hypothetical protein
MEPVFEKLHQFGADNAAYKPPSAGTSSTQNVTPSSLMSSGAAPAPVAQGGPLGESAGDTRFTQLFAAAIGSFIQRALSSPTNEQLQPPPAVRPGNGPFKGRRTVDLGAQAVESFATWSFWGVTNVFMENLGPVSTDVTLQAGAALPEPIRLTPAGTDGSVDHVGRQWAGFTVYIQNASRDPNSLVRVTVW